MRACVCEFFFQPQHIGSVRRPQGHSASHLLVVTSFGLHTHSSRLLRTDIYLRVNPLIQFASLCLMYAALATLKRKRMQPGAYLLNLRERGVWVTACTGHAIRHVWLLYHGIFCGRRRADTYNQASLLPPPTHQPIPQRQTDTHTYTQTCPNRHLLTHYFFVFNTDKCSSKLYFPCLSVFSLVWFIQNPLQNPAPFLKELILLKFTIKKKKSSWNFSVMGLEVCWDCRDLGTNSVSTRDHWATRLIIHSPQMVNGLQCVCVLKCNPILWLLWL